jgi:hypothetical protein
VSEKSKQFIDSYYDKYGIEPIDENRNVNLTDTGLIHFLERFHQYIFEQKETAKDELIAKQAEENKLLKSYIYRYYNLFPAKDDRDKKTSERLVELESEIAQLTSEIEAKDEICPNCKETSRPCACMRNSCIKCGKPVGNITFTVCDQCWDDKSEKPEPVSADITYSDCRKFVSEWLWSSPERTSESFDNAQTRDAAMMIKEYATLRAAQGKGKEIQRYRFIEQVGYPIPDRGRMIEDENGEWIKFESQTPVQSVSEEATYEDIRKFIIETNYKGLDIEGWMGEISAEIQLIEQWIKYRKIKSVETKTKE